MPDDVVSIGSARIDDLLLIGLGLTADERIVEGYAYSCGHFPFFILPAKAF